MNTLKLKFLDIDMKCYIYEKCRDMTINKTMRNALQMRSNMMNTFLSQRNLFYVKYSEHKLKISIIETFEKKQSKTIFKLFKNDGYILKIKSVTNHF